MEIASAGHRETFNNLFDTKCQFPGTLLHITTGSDRPSCMFSFDDVRQLALPASTWKSGKHLKENSICLSNFTCKRRLDFNQLTLANTRHEDADVCNNNITKKNRVKSVNNSTRKCNDDVQECFTTAITQASTARQNHHLETHHHHLDSKYRHQQENPQIQQHDPASHHQEHYQQHDPASHHQEHYHHQDSPSHHQEHYHQHDPPSHHQEHYQQHDPPSHHQEHYHHQDSSSHHQEHYHQHDPPSHHQEHYHQENQHRHHQNGNHRNSDRSRRNGHHQNQVKPLTTAVQRRNERERNRVKLINMTFATLREYLPSGTKGNRSKKMSKVETLKAAIEYISYLKELVDDEVSSQTTSSIPVSMDMSHQSVTSSSITQSSPNPSTCSDSSCGGISIHDDDLLDFSTWF